MSNYINKVILMGNVGSEPEIKVSNDSKIAIFSLATSESWKDKATDAWKSITQWHKIVVYNQNLVKVCEQHVKKGSRVYLEGTTKTSEYIDKENVKRFNTNVILKFDCRLIVLDKEKESANIDTKQEQEQLYDEIPF